jgi:hypothetical protein
VLWVRDSFVWIRIRTTDIMAPAPALFISGFGVLLIIFDDTFRSVFKGKGHKVT